MSDHIKAIFEGQELSDDFKAKTTSIVEAMIAEKESQIREEVEAEQRELFESQIDEKTAELETITEAYVKEEVVPTVGKYLTAAVSEWLEENTLAVESGVKVELAESFLKGFVGLAESHNLSVPKGADSIVEKAQKEAQSANDKLDRLIEKNVALQEALDTQTRSIVVGKVGSDLTESQKEKFETYTARVEFKDAEQFKDAISQLKESYFPAGASEDEQLSETVDDSATVDTLSEAVEDDSYLRSFMSKL